MTTTIDADTVRVFEPPVYPRTLFADHQKIQDVANKLLRASVLLNEAALAFKTALESPVPVESMPNTGRVNPQPADALTGSDEDLGYNPHVDAVHLLRPATWPMDAETTDQAHSPVQSSRAKQTRHTGDRRGTENVPRGTIRTREPYSRRVCASCRRRKVKCVSLQPDGPCIECVMRSQPCVYTEKPDPVGGVTIYANERSS